MTEKEMVESVAEWPKWPILPLCRRSQPMTEDGCGFLFVDNPTKIYLGNLYGISEIHPKPKSWAEILPRYTSIDYSTVDAMLKEWRVD